MGRRTLLLVAALVVAAVGTSLVFLYVNGVNDRALADQRPVNVLVATKIIAAGTTAEEAERSASLDLKPVSRGSAAPGALGDIEAIRTKVAVSTIYPGEQILQQKFSDSAQTSPLVIPQGKLAVSVSLNDPNRVANFVTPGSDVAVFMTIGDTGAGGLRRTKVLLPKVRVIANGDRTLTSPAPAPGTASQSPVFTLAVNQADAQRLILASQLGQLYFALIGGQAVVNPGDPGVRSDQIGG
ncbi:MAG: pilus assembly protein CpaB [Actinomycetota bacterium]|jgi:pilus assembly protein CpaB|nr:pilus assembly protein CpaB [Actinomycetota bacterium]